MTNNGRVAALLLLAASTVGCASQAEKPVEVRRALPVTIKRAIVVSAEETTRPPKRKQPPRRYAHTEPPSSADATHSLVEANPEPVPLMAETKSPTPAAEPVEAEPEAALPPPPVIREIVAGPPSPGADISPIRQLADQIDVSTQRMVGAVEKLDREAETQHRSAMDELQIANLRLTIIGAVVIILVCSAVAAFLVIHNRYMETLCRLEKIIQDQSAQISRLRPYAPFAVSVPEASPPEKRSVRKARAPRQPKSMKAP